jgi:hypothetical protein
LRNPRPWCVVRRDDAVGRLDLGLAVDAKLCDEDAQECLGLLGLALLDDLVEPVGDGCEIGCCGRARRFVVVVG